MKLQQPTSRPPVLQPVSAEHVHPHLDDVPFHHEKQTRPPADGPCRHDCALRHSSQCVCRLLGFTEQDAPISYGLRVGLDSLYSDVGLPPCVQGPVGASYWSGLPDTASRLCS